MNELQKGERRKEKGERRKEKGERRKEKENLLSEKTDFNCLKDFGSESGLVKEINSACHDPILETVKVIGDEILLEGVTLVGSTLEDHAENVGTKHLNNDVNDAFFHFSQLFKEQRDARKTVEGRSCNCGYLLGAKRKNRLDDLFDKRNTFEMGFACQIKHQTSSFHFCRPKGERRGEERRGEERRGEEKQTLESG